VPMRESPALAAAWIGDLLEGVAEGFELGGCERTAGATAVDG
jgi:hypothetical protein